jgi:hypothetical protein
MSNKNRTGIKLVRLKNGDTIICSLSIDNSDYILENPMQINMLPVMSKKGIQSMTIFMQEWMEYSKDRIYKISEDVIMLTANPEEEMIDEYFDALEKNEMHRIQREFENISKNYDNESELENQYDSDLENRYDEDEYYEDDETPEDSE